MKKIMPPLREILVLHHSHLDVGYTHSQPVAWELHREYLGQALDLLDATSDWPDDGSRPKWTCEVNEPVLRWLEHAPEADIARFRFHAAAGRLAIGAMRFGITATMDASQLGRQLAPLAHLRRELGTPIRAAHQHDVSGVPWPLADHLLDHDVGLLVMAVNRHLANHVRPRPGVFRWLTPSGRELRVLNGNHYTMFDQILLSWEQSLDSMRKGLDSYLKHLDEIDYPHDFLYLTTTAAPEMWDNSPPNLSSARLIREWNARGLEPRIRFVTSEDLADRIAAMPADNLPVLSGDWTDYWNFGCASAAADLARNRAAKRDLACADRITGGTSGSAALAAVRKRCCDRIDLYDEHTWSYWDTAGAEEPCLVLDTLKSALAIEGRELAGYLLTHGLESLAANPPHSGGPPDHVLLVNPSPLPRREWVTIPRDWFSPGPRLRCQRFAPSTPAPADQFEPVELPPWSWRRVPLATLRPAQDDPRLFHKDLRDEELVRSFNNVRIVTSRRGHAILESPHHRLSYDPASGRILGLWDKKSDRDVLAAHAEFGFFDFVRERPDAQVDGRREAYYERDLDKEKFDQSCWKPWRAVREKATRVTRVEISRDAGSITLERDFEAPGTSALRQKITLHAESPVLEIRITIDKLAYADPEAVYFAVPLRLASGWRCHFDTAGQAVELDAEQLPGACRNWFTAGSYASLHSPDFGTTLFCPEAPMVMAGGFHFGPPLESIPRQQDPLLLAWPINNYWNTNFPLTQPGRIGLRYGLWTHGAFDPMAATSQAAAFAQPVIVHPAFGGHASEGRLPDANC